MLEKTPVACIILIYFSGHRPLLRRTCVKHSFVFLFILVVWYSGVPLLYETNSSVCSFVGLLKQRSVLSTSTVITAGRLENLRAEFSLKKAIIV